MRSRAWYSVSSAHSNMNQQAVLSCVDYQSQPATSNFTNNEHAAHCKQLKSEARYHQLEYTPTELLAKLTLQMFAYC
jgi:hypothetical protein